MNLRKLAEAREKASQDKVDLFDFYNKNWDGLIQEIVALRGVAELVDEGPECEECGNTIPDVGGGGLANKHHADSCSLYDANED